MAESNRLFAYALTGRDTTGKSVEDMVYEAQRKVILEIAENDSCVIIGRNTDYILKDFLGNDEISTLLDEYNERKTEEAKFAYHCEKLECDIQMKLYDQEGCFDLNNQPNNPIINNPSVKKVLDSEKSISNAWIEFDRSKYEDDKNFIEIIEYLKENEI